MSYAEQKERACEIQDEIERVTDAWMEENKETIQDMVNAIKVLKIKLTAVGANEIDIQAELEYIKGLL